MTFSDAIDGATGKVAHIHRYALGGQYALSLSVSDDDGGVEVESSDVHALTPEEALAEILKLIADAIAAASNPAVRAALENALRALLGHERMSDGALRMLAQHRPGWRGRRCRSGASMQRDLHPSRLEATTCSAS